MRVQRKVLLVQPSSRVDEITADGHELTQLPYPLTGLVEDGTLFPAGSRLDIVRLVGFQRDLAVQRVDLWWRDAVRDPAATVGMYLVTQDKGGGMAVHQTAIESYKEFEVWVDEPDVTLDPDNPASPREGRHRYQEGE